MPNTSPDNLPTALPNIAGDSSGIAEDGLVKALKSPTINALLRRAPAGGLDPSADILGPFPHYRYNGGQFIPASVWQYQKIKAASDFPKLIRVQAQLLDVLLASYEQNTRLEALARQHPQIMKDFALVLTPLPEIKTAIAGVIASGYRQSMLLGRRSAGNLAELTRTEEARLETLVANQMTYMGNFQADIDGGYGTLPYAARMEMYAKRMRESFWDGYLTANVNTARTITWHLGNTIEHCATCAAMVALGPVPAAKFISNYASVGILPQSGSLACKGFNCDCYLTSSE